MIFLPDVRLKYNDFDYKDYLSEPHIVFEIKEIISYVVFKEGLSEYYSPAKKGFLQTDHCMIKKCLKRTKDSIFKEAKDV